MNDKETLNITPGTELLDAMRRQSLGWEKALSELIDNSFDAGANRVSIQIGSSRVLVKDDGNGCDNILAMLRIAHHHETGTTSLGMYGVGLKDAAVWFWGETHIKTIKDGVSRKASADWAKIRASGKWEIETIKSHSDQINGTEISFEGIERKMQEFDRLCSKLSYTFSPAIKSGRQLLIGFNKPARPVPLFEFPPLEHCIEAESDVNGKMFRVKAGVVTKDFPNPRPGYTISYGHRVITNTINGCGEYKPTRFFAYVELCEGWELTRNKEGVIDEDRELEEALFRICEPILRESDRASQVMQLKGISDLLSGMFTKWLNPNSKEKRDEGDSEGTVAPKNTGRKRQYATVTQPGKRSIRTPACGKIDVTFESFGDEKQLGEVIRGNSTIVRLNSNHPAVRVWHESESEAELSLLAASLLAQDIALNPDDKQKELIPADNTGERFSYLLSTFASQLVSEEVAA
jgi:hypothetical protein